MTAKQNIADFTRSKIGGFIIYGAALTLPAGVASTIYDSLVPDLEQTTSSESRQAVDEYLSQNQSLEQLHEKIKTLGEAAEQQQGADNILSVKEKQLTLKKELHTKAHDFSVRVLNDERLTESDYDIIEDTVYLDGLEYMSPNLPNVAEALSECRIDAPENEKSEKAQNIRDCMMDTGETKHTLSFGGGIGMIFLYAFLLPGIGFLEEEKLREKLAKKIEKKYTNLKH